MNRFFLIVIVLALALIVANHPAAAIATEADEQLVLATYKLANTSSTATGFVVARAEDGDDNDADADAEKPARFLVTAHHVLNQMKGDTCQLVARTRKKDGTFSRNEIALLIRRDGNDLWKKHPNHDLAVLALPDDIDVNALPFESLASEDVLKKKVHAGDGVRLAVFPEQNEANGAGFPLLRKGAIASYPLTPIKPHPAFLVDTTAWSGDSGGPVIHETARTPGGHPLVIGIVRGKRSITDTVKESRYVERKTHYPLDISEILHAAFVRDMISDFEP